MGVVYTDKSDAFLKRVEKAAESGLDRATLFVSTEMSESMPDAPVPTGEGGWKTRTNFHSAPGRPPWAQSGNLRRNLANGRVSRLKWAAGTIRGMTMTDDGKYNYGLLLEFGTSKMAARPWARPAINNNRIRIGKEFIKGFQASMGGGT